MNCCDEHAKHLRDDSCPWCELTDLRERLAAAEKDAERYRWLRDSDSKICIYEHQGLVDHGSTGVADVGEILTGSYADTAIDAAREREGKE